MHPAFDCFEWGMFEVHRPHPVHPDGPWSHAVLSRRRDGRQSEARGISRKGMRSPCWSGSRTKTGAPTTRG